MYTTLVCHRSSSRLTHGFVLAVAMMATAGLATAQNATRIDLERPLRENRVYLVEKAPFFALSLVICAVTLFAQWKGGAVRSFEAVPLGLRLVARLRFRPTWILPTPRAAGVNGAAL